MITTDCDWCGLPFLSHEKPVRGYDNKPTHAFPCAPIAKREWARDQWLAHGVKVPHEREPFIDWPNGQGV